MKSRTPREFADRIKECVSLNQEYTKDLILLSLMPNRYELLEVSRLVDLNSINQYGESLLDVLIIEYAHLCTQDTSGEIENALRFLTKNIVTLIKMGAKPFKTDFSIFFKTFNKDVLKALESLDDNALIGNTPFLESEHCGACLVHFSPLWQGTEDLVQSILFFRQTFELKDKKGRTVRDWLKTM